MKLPNTLYKSHVTAFEMFLLILSWEHEPAWNSTTKIIQTLISLLENQKPIFFEAYSLNSHSGVNRIYLSHSLVVQQWDYRFRPCTKVHKDLENQIWIPDGINLKGLPDRPITRGQILQMDLIRDLSPMEETLYIEKVSYNTSLQTLTDIVWITS